MSRRKRVVVKTAGKNAHFPVPFLFGGKNFGLTLSHSVRLRIGAKQPPRRHLYRSSSRSFNHALINRHSASIVETESCIASAVSLTVKPAK